MILLVFGAEGEGLIAVYAGKSPVLITHDILLSLNSWRKIRVTEPGKYWGRN